MFILNNSDAWLYLVRGGLDFATTPQRADLVIAPHTYYNFLPFECYRYGAYLDNPTNAYDCIIFFVYGYAGEDIENAFFFDDIIYELSDVIEVAEVLEEITEAVEEPLYNSDSEVMGILWRDGFITTTNDFQSGSPTPTHIDLSLANTPFFAVDYRCPLMQGTGTQFDFYFLEGASLTEPENIYHCADAFGARTLTLLHTFTPPSPMGGGLTGIATHYKYPGFVACCGVGSNNLPDHYQIFCVVSNDGDNFTDNAITPDSDTNLGSSAPSSICIDDNGYVYCVYGWNSDTEPDILNGIHKSVDGGVTFDDSRLFGVAVNSSSAIRVVGSDVYYGVVSGGGGAGLHKNGVRINTLRPSTQQALFNPFNVSSTIILGGIGATLNPLRSDNSGTSFGIVGSSVNITYLGCLLAGDDSAKSLWWGDNIAVSNTALGARTAKSGIFRAGQVPIAMFRGA